jgi:hypothetical protein
MKLEEGAITDSGNFRLTKKITDLNGLWEVLNNNQSLFARHRIYPAAFFMSWHFREVKVWLDRGWFWEAEKVSIEQLNEE